MNFYLLNACAWVKVKRTYCRLRVMFLNPLVIASSKLFIALWNSELVGPLYIIVRDSSWFSPSWFSPLFWFCCKALTIGLHWKVECLWWYIKRTYWRLRVRLLKPLVMESSILFIALWNLHEFLLITQQFSHDLNKHIYSELVGPVYIVYIVWVLCI